MHAPFTDGDIRELTSSDMFTATFRFGLSKRLLTPSSKRSNSKSDRFGYLQRQVRIPPDGTASKQLKN